jgi:alkanesulfonate monooxygenase SsuD/methylene tetrahydromethanopterin reductase-like flavin-dependent oxidoreductase (luciferase family)
MQIFSFNFLSYPYLPQDYAGSAWITCPNELYDPKIGHGLYRDYLDQLVHTEALGFDGIGLNEHHQTPYCGMPSPNIVASALIQRTTTARICVLGNALPLYDPPLRVAEEYAMLDVMSGGRLMAGVVPGDQASYYSYGVNPAQARARFAEALDLLVQAWTRPGPFEFNGEFYRFPYVNPWPRPLQQPHPPIWIPGLGSPETQEMRASRFFHARWSTPTSPASARCGAQLATHPRPTISAWSFRSMSRRTTPRRAPSTRSTTSTSRRS